MFRRPLVAVLAAVSMAVGLPALGIGVEAAGADPVTPKVLLVTEGVSAGSLETPLVTRLQGLGFTVQTVADEAVNAAVTRGMHLVVVSPTVESAQFTGDDLVKVSVPIISMKAYEQDGLQMAGPNAGVDHGTVSPSTDRVQVSLPHHPLAANLSGSPIITTTPLAIGWVKLPPDVVKAQAVAKDAAGNPVLFAWTPGDAMFPEIKPNRTVELLKAHGCRVGFPGQRNSATSFTPDGWKLFDAAVSWSRSSACGPTRPHPINPPVKTCQTNEAPADVPETATSSGYNWPQWVDEVLYHQGVYYLGGRFTQVSNWDGSGTVARPGLAACDASTGQVLPWNPNLPIAANPPVQTDAQMVRSLAADGGWLYVGGKFDVTSPTGTLKKNFLRVSLAVPPNWQAVVDWNWGPALQGGVQAILIDPGAAIYLGGGLRKVNDVDVNELVKLNPLDGSRDPNFAPDFVTVAPLRPGCTPQPPPGDACTTDPYGQLYSDFASVHSLALDGNDLYVGGAFTKVNGIDRAGVAVLPKSTGSGAGTFVADLRDANTYDPLVQVHDIFVHAGYVYLCGDWWITENQGQLSDPGKDELKDQQYNSGKFYKSGASVRVPVPDGANSTRPWGPRTDGAIQACDIDPQSNLFYLGGHFDLTNSRHIGKLAAADLSTGELLESWDTDSTRVRGLDAVEAIPGESVAVAGTFNRTGAVDQISFAAFAIGQPGTPAGGAMFPTQTAPVGGPIPPLTKRGGGSPSTNVCACPAADPVDTSTGNFYENFTDLVVPGRGVPLAFTRSYNASPTPAPTDGPLGYGWSFNYNISLSIAVDLSSVTVNEENGAAVTFTLNGPAYTAPPRVMATLVRNGDNTWTFTRRNREIYLFNSSGRLTAQKDLNGYTTNLSYSGAQLTTVTDPATRTLTIGWTGTRITSVTDTATPPRSVTFSYSPAGDLTDVIDVGGGHSTFSYDANHRMKTKRAPKFYGDITTTPAPEVTNTYDGTGRVATQRDELGRITTFDYTSIPNATKITDPKGNVRVDTFQYDLLVSRTLGYGTPAAATTQYRYDPATLARTAILDPNGDVTTMVYDSAGNLLSSTDALGRTTWSTYNALNQPLTVTDAAGLTTTFTYNPAGNPLTASAPLEGSNPPVSATTTSTYDPARPGDVTSTTDPDGKVWPRTWDASGNLATETDPLGNMTRYCYDPVGRRTKVISPKGTAAAVTCTTVNPTFTTIIAPDPFGAPLSVTDPLGHQTISTYDANHNPKTVTDANGHTTTWTYDPANKLGEEIRPATGAGGGGSGVIAMEAWSAGHNDVATSLVVNKPLNTEAGDVLIAGVATRGTPAVTPPTGWTLIRSRETGSSWTLQSYSRVAGASEPANYTWTFSDARAAAGTITAYSGVDTANPIDVSSGQLTSTATTSIAAPSVTTAVANAMIVGLFAHDGAAAITAPTGMTERGEDNSNVSGQSHVAIETADVAQPTVGATGTKTATAAASIRSAAQLIALRPAPSGGGGPTTLRYDYHPDGSLWRYYDGANQATTYGYDALGRQTTETDPLNRTTTYGYDVAGRLISKQDHGGSCAAVPKTGCTTMSYDDAGQFTRIDYSDPATPDVTNVSYDNLGRRTSMTDGTGTSTWQWDSLGRLTRSVDGAGKTIGYGYDRRSNLTSLTYPGSTGAVMRTVDDASRLWKVKDWANRETVFTYDANSFLTSQAYPNGTTGTYTPDNAEGLMSVKHAPTAAPNSPFASFNYGRDNADLLASVTSIGVPADNHTYGYTAINQLETADGGASWAYDLADNLTTMPGGKTQLYDAANQLCWTATTTGASCSAAPTGATTYQYDSRGNRTSASISGVTTTLTYDQANRLTAHGTANTYAYNGDGLRMSKTVSGATSTFTWAAAEGLPLLLVDGTTNYIYGPGGVPLEQITSSGAVTYYHHDQLGNTRALTNSTGAVVATYTYDPYGKRTASTGTAINPFGYTGQYTDAETGFQYLRTRYYDPSTGNFLTRDPLEAQTREPYSYTGGNPLNYTDPAGLNKCEVGANPVRWFGNGIDCASKVDPDDVIEAGLDAAVPGLGDALANNTTMFCVGVSGGALLGVDFNACIGQSHLDEIGVSFTSGGGYQIPATGGASLTGGISNATRWSDLGGPFDYAGGSIGPVSGEYQWGTDSCGRSVYVATGGVGVGALPVEGHWGRSNTWTASLSPF